MRRMMCGASSRVAGRSRYPLDSTCGSIGRSTRLSASAHVRRHFSARKTFVRGAARMDAPPPQRGRGNGGPRGRGAPRRGHAGAPSIPKNLPTYAPQRSSAVSEVAFIVTPSPQGPISFSSAALVASASPRGRGGRGGRGGNRGRGRGGRGRGISTQSQAPAPPSPSPAAVQGLASPDSPAPATPPVVPNLAPRASPSPAKHEEVQRLREAKANNIPGYEMAIVETVERMLTHTKGRPNQQTRAYIHNAMRTQYGASTRPSHQFISHSLRSSAHPHRESEHLGGYLIPVRRLWWCARGD